MKGVDTLVQCEACDAESVYGDWIRHPHLRRWQGVPCVSCPECGSMHQMPSWDPSGEAYCNCHFSGGSRFCGVRHEMDQGPQVFPVVTGGVSGMGAVDDDADC